MRKETKLLFYFACFFISFKAKSQSELIPVQVGKYWGYADEKGMIIINPTFEEAYRFSDGLALVLKRGMQYQERYRTGWGFINTKGEYVINPIYSKFITSNFADGYAVVTKTVQPDSSITYIINKKGNAIFSDSGKNFRITTYLYGGLAELYTNRVGAYGFVNTNGKIIKLPSNYNVAGFKYKDRDEKHTGVAYYGSFDFDKQALQKINYIDFNGNVLHNFTPSDEKSSAKADSWAYWSICYNSYYLYSLKGDEKHYGVMTMAGKSILPTIYELSNIRAFSKDLVFFRNSENELFSALNLNGIQVIVSKFDNVNTGYNSGEK